MKWSTNLTFGAIILALATSGCAVAQTTDTTQPASNTAPAGIDLSKLPIHRLVKADLDTAAAYAESNGYPARAAVYRAIRKQVEACEAAVAAATATTPPSGTVGAITLFEIGAEAVGRGIPAAVKINCSVIVLP